MFNYWSGRINLLQIIRLSLLICEIKIRSHASKRCLTSQVRYVGDIIWSGSTTYPRNGIFTLKGNKGMNKTRESCPLTDKTYGGRRGYRGHEVTRTTRGHTQSRVGLKFRHVYRHVADLSQIWIHRNIRHFELNRYLFNCTSIILQCCV